MVVREPKARAEDLGRHRRGRRLAVRGRDDGDSGRQAGGQPVDRAGVELREELARHRHPRAAPEQPRECGDGARSGYLGGETHRPRVRDNAGYLDRVNRAVADPSGGGDVPEPAYFAAGMTCICGPCALPRTDTNERNQVEDAAVPSEIWR